MARGRTACCAAHGGGPRCQADACVRAAICKTPYCRRHNNILGGFVGAVSKAHPDPEPDLEEAADRDGPPGVSPTVAVANKSRNAFVGV